MTRSLIVFACMFLFFSCSSPVEESESIRITDLNNTGNLKWEFKTDKSLISFVLEVNMDNKSWSSNRTIVVNTDSLIKNASGYYALQEHVLFHTEEMQVRLLTRGFVNDTTSNIVTVKYKSPWLTDNLTHDQDDTILLKFSTHYRAYDENGDLVLNDTGNKIIFAGLPIGMYYLDAANFANEYSYRSPSTTEGGPECIYKRTKLSINSSFPFNKATSTRLISYTSEKREAVILHQLIKEGKCVIDPSEEIILTKQQTDTLFIVLNSYQRVSNESSAAKCYDPHHAIIFYEGAKAIAFLEICFKCSGVRQSSSTDFGIFCQEKFCGLNKFFSSCGIKQITHSIFCE